MSYKTSKVEKCVFSNEWKNPSGTLTYYHDVTLENGDTGSIGAIEKYPKKFTEGTIIDYELQNGKIKIMQNQNDNGYSSSNKPRKQGNSGTSNYSSYQSNKGTKQEQFLGYAWSYAKDLIVAGKTSEDLEELNKCARYIYEEIGRMLNNE